jgi:hypothetical protein
LSDGEFLNSQPEKIFRQDSGSVVRARSSTKTWTKAPTSGGLSHGRLRSHVATRMMTLPTRRDSPDFITRSCDRLLRLLSRPIVATRSLTGVPNWLSTAEIPTGVAVTALGTSVAAGSAP